MTIKTLFQLLLILPLTSGCGGSSRKEKGYDSITLEIVEITASDLVTPIDSFDISKISGEWKKTLLWTRENGKWIGWRDIGGYEWLILKPDGNCEHRFYDRNKKITIIRTNYWDEPGRHPALITFLTLSDLDKKYKRGDKIKGVLRNVLLLNDSTLRLASPLTSQEPDSVKSIYEYKKIKNYESSGRALFRPDESFLRKKHMRPPIPDERSL